MSLINKKFVILSSSRLLHACATFLNFKLLTYYLDKSQVGLYFLLLSFASYFGLVLVNPFGVYLNRHLHEWNQDSTLLKHLNRFVHFIFFVGLIAIPISYIFTKLMIHLHGTGVDNLSDTFIVCFLVLYVVAINLGNTFVPALNILGHINLFSFLLPATHILSLFITVAIAHYYQINSILWLLAIGISHLLAFFISYGFIHKNYKAKQIDSNPLHNWRAILKFSLPLIICNISLWILTQGYRPISERFVDLTYLSFVGFGLTLSSTIANNVEYLLQQYLMPNFLKNITNVTKANREQAWSLFANKSLPIYLTLTLFLMGMAPFIISIMANNEYRPAIYFLIMGAWIELLRMTLNLLNLVGQSEKQNEKNIVPYSTGAGITITSLLLFGYLHQLEYGLPFAIIFGYLGAVLSVYFKFKTDFKFKIDFKKIFKKIMPATVFLLGPFIANYSSSMLFLFFVLGLAGIYLVFLFLIYLKESEQS